jgi:hypothetical protein
MRPSIVLAHLQHGGRCAVNGECAGDNCVNFKCVTPTCSPNCLKGNGCDNDSECASNNCSSNKCIAPSCANNCKLGDACEQNSDCKSGNCNVLFLCGT